MFDLEMHFVGSKMQVQVKLLLCEPGFILSDGQMRMGFYCSESKLAKGVLSAFNGGTVLFIFLVDEANRKAPFYLLMQIGFLEAPLS